MSFPMFHNPISFNDYGIRISKLALKALGIAQVSKGKRAEHFYAKYHSLWNKRNNKKEGGI